MTKHQLLIERIDEQLARFGLSDRAAGLAAGLHADTIRSIRRGHAPQAARLVKLAKILGVEAAYLLSAAPADYAPPEPQDERIPPDLAAIANDREIAYILEADTEHDRWYRIANIRDSYAAEARRHAKALDPNSVN